MTNNELLKELKELVQNMRKSVCSNGSGLRGIDLQRFLLKKKAIIYYADKLEKIIEDYEKSKDS